MTSENFMDEPGSSGILDLAEPVTKATEALLIAFPQMKPEIAQYFAQVCIYNAAPYIYNAIPGLEVEFVSVGDSSTFPLVDGHPNKDDYHPEPPC